ncbi:PepSY domain-containing protein [Helicobacter sp. 13S00477-4]|uniref:PepSY domain-containing protein n=1 Tax=Helicobacter sp. 13S00477-4 TaxID=1905759 RepID=UPI000BA4F07F|nr:PepSY domain-containing protein [Helicobacter sp. 13S00477-4]PAF51259.1 hypothetical protein BKH44_06010 [Helicobacter sp. 13S00477-4]
MTLKKFSRQFHIYVSIFLLPMALLYSITGIVYIFGINQDVWANKNKWVIEKNIPKKKQLDFLIDFLSEHQITFPDELNPKESRGILMIGSAKYSISLEVKNNQTIIQTIKRSFLGNMIMLHKAKGKWYFDILSIAFGISLVLFYLSGIIMTAFCKANLKEVLLSFFIGLIVAITLGYLSL